MIAESPRIKARDYIGDLAATGRYHFVSNDARNALGVSADATRLALNRLTRRNMLAQPARGFYVIVPRAHAPWVEDSQVEKDLVISRAPIAVFAHPIPADQPSEAVRCSTNSTFIRWLTTPKT